MCPTIVVDTQGDVLLATGASGGSKITSSTAYVIHLALLISCSFTVNEFGVFYPPTGDAAFPLPRPPTRDGH